MALLDQLSYGWISQLLNTPVHYRSRKIDELNQIGAAEIAASSKWVPLSDKNVRLATAELSQVTKPTLVDRVFGKSRTESRLNLWMLEGDLEQDLRRIDERILNDDKHVYRVEAMLNVAKAVEKAHQVVHAIYYSCSLSSWTPSDLKHIEFTINQRIQTLATHLAVLTQARLANGLMRNNITQLLAAIRQTLYTNTLAQKVQDNVREISKNDALALESGVAERRPTNQGLELFDRAGNCYYREDGRGKHHLISEAYTRSQLGQSLSSLTGMG